MAIGGTQQFTATGTYSDGTNNNLTASATWSSSNTGIATVSNTSGSQGLATGVALGATTITATVNSIKGSTSLAVQNGTTTVVELEQQPVHFGSSGSVYRHGLAQHGYRDGAVSGQRQPLGYGHTEWRDGELHDQLSDIRVAQYYGRVHGRHERHRQHVGALGGDRELMTKPLGTRVRLTRFAV